MLLHFEPVMVSTPDEISDPNNQRPNVGIGGQQCTIQNRISGKFASDHRYRKAPELGQHLLIGPNGVLTGRQPCPNHSSDVHMQKLILKLE